MYDPQPLPLWIIPLFPVFFVAIWLVVTASLSLMGGWGELARLYREPADNLRSRIAPGASLHLRRGWMPLPVNYNRCVIVDILPAGLHLRVWAVFRFLHPPLLIPWTAMERVEPGRFLGWHTLSIQPRGTSTHIRLYGGAVRAVGEAARQATTRGAQLAPV